jgi:hypothetical protein
MADKNTAGLNRALMAAFVLALSIIPHHRSGYSTAEGIPEVKAVCFSGTDYEVGLQKAKVYLDDLKKWRGISEKLFNGPDGLALKSAYQRCITSLKERSGLLLDEYKGMADGAGMKLEDMVIAHIGEESLWKAAGLPVPDELANRASSEPACSVVAMTDSDRGPLVMNTGDVHDPPKPSSVYSIEKLNYAGSYRVVRCKGAGLNEKGLAIGSANAHYLGAAGTADGPSDGLSLLALRFCADTNEAITYITNYRFTDDGEHFALVDLSGDAAAIEKGPGSMINIRRSRGNRDMVWVTNVSSDSYMRSKWDDVNYPAEHIQNSNTRYNNLQNIFNNPAFKFTYSQMEAIAFDHNSVGAICQHGDVYPGQWYTNRTRLMLPKEAKLLLAARLTAGGEWRPCKLGWIAQDVLEIVRVLGPNGGESLKAGSTYTINWKSLGAIGNVRIEYSTDNGAHWTEAAANINNTSSYAWLVPQLTSNQCLIRISSAANSDIDDTSDAVFTISQENPPATGAGEKL